MREILEAFRAHYRAEGFDQGAACGEDRGKAEGTAIGEECGKAEGIAIGEECGKAEGIVIGEERGKAEGIVIGEERGKYEGFRKMTKRIMAFMGKTLEDDMTYLQLTDDEKQQLRQAF